MKPNNGTPPLRQPKNRLIMALFAVLTAFLSILTPALATSVAHADPDEPEPQFVYRADLLAPEDMLRQGGFFPRGMDDDRPRHLPPDTSLYSHTLGTPTGISRDSSGYVSTTADPNFARRFIQTMFGGRGYIYTIRPSGNFIDARRTLRQFNPHPDEYEFAALGIIHASQVVAWTPVVGGAEQPEVLNRQYDRRFDNSHVGGAQYQLAGFPPGFRAWSMEPWRQFANCHTELRGSGEVCDPKEPNRQFAVDFLTQYLAKYFPDEL